MEQQLTTKDLEKQLLEYIDKKDPISFEQKADDIDFGMSTQALKGSFTKPIITMAVGSASSGLIAGAIASAIPVNLQFFAGFPTILAGVLGRVVLGTKSATIKNFFDGVLIAGISQTVSRFIPATFSQMPSIILGGKSSTDFSQSVKQEYKQEAKPCDESIQQLRSDVRW